MNPIMEEVEGFLERSKKCGETTYNEAHALLERILNRHKEITAAAPGAPEAGSKVEQVNGQAPQQEASSEGAPAGGLDSNPQVAAANTGEQQADQ